MLNEIRHRLHCIEVNVIWTMKVRDHPENKQVSSIKSDGMDRLW